MAFEAFRTAGANRARSRWRPIIYAGSVLLHLALISTGVAYSFWHVEELSPPRLKLTFMAAAPPPPPPPPPPSGGAGPARKKVVPKVRVPPNPTAIVQPKETPKREEPPKEEPKSTEGAGQKGGVIGGQQGGVIGGQVGGVIGGEKGGKQGGTIGGTGTSGVGPAKLMPMHLGAAQKLSGADPPFPPSLRKAGVVYHVMVMICVSPAGTVDKVILKKGADPLLDDGVLGTVKTWHYRPMAPNGIAVPFCYPAAFDFKPE
jgi:protein TonB